MPDSEDFLAAFLQEAERLGLDPVALPDFAMAADDASTGQLLERMRGLAPPVTWRDVFPQLPDSPPDGVSEHD